ncbi:MAG: hypothetical protein Q4B22_06475 [Eubacteriales bacterium]|nr:hypothetical protein [Eubacteriales bacterium]
MIDMGILQRDGLTLEVLEHLSYESELGISLKKNLHHFDQVELFQELIKVNAWYDNFAELQDVALDYRIKSIQSAVLKYRRYYPDHQARKVFNDLLGFRSLCDNYEDVLKLQAIPELRVADISKGKANDDGYRGIHVYYQLSNKHYPIEIQYNTYYDRQLNNWLHKYLYKKKYDNSVGCKLREAYENARIFSESDFKEVLKGVLSSGKTY